MPVLASVGVTNDKVVKKCPSTLLSDHLTSRHAQAALFWIFCFLFGVQMIDNAHCHTELQKILSFVVEGM